MPPSGNLAVREEAVGMAADDYVFLRPGLLRPSTLRVISGRFHDSLQEFPARMAVKRFLDEAPGYYFGLSDEQFESLPALRLLPFDADTQTFPLPLEFRGRDVQFGSDQGMRDDLVRLSRAFLKGRMLPVSVLGRPAFTVFHNVVLSQVQDVQIYQPSDALVDVTFESALTYEFDIKESLNVVDITDEDEVSTAIDRCLDRIRTQIENAVPRWAKLGRPRSQDALYTDCLVEKYIVGRSWAEIAELHGVGEEGGLDPNFLGREVRELLKRLREIDEMPENSNP